MVLKSIVASQASLPPCYNYPPLGSKRFNAMLSKHFVEGSSDIIEIPDIKYSIFEVTVLTLVSGDWDTEIAIYC